jgi:predicted membrane protein
MPKYIFTRKNILWVVIKLKNSNVFSFKWIVILYVYLLYKCRPLKKKKSEQSMKRKINVNKICVIATCVIFDTTNMLNGGWLANTIASLQRYQGSNLDINNHIHVDHT